MDNAGSHVTNVTKMEYTDILKLHYNIKICSQIVNSPETNILDLCIWCILESLVEYLHHHYQIDEDFLARTIDEVWNLMDGYNQFDAVHTCWKKVLSLIFARKWSYV